MKKYCKFLVMSLVLFLCLSLNTYAQEKKSAEEKLKEVGFDISKIDYKLTKADILPDGKVLTVEYYNPNHEWNAEITVRIYNAEHQLINSFKSYDKQALTFFDDRNRGGYYQATVDYPIGDEMKQMFLYINEYGEALFGGPFYEIKASEFGYLLIKLSKDMDPHYLVDMDGNILRKFDGFSYLGFTDDKNKLNASTHKTFEESVIDLNGTIDKDSGEFKILPDENLPVKKVSELTEKMHKDLASAKGLGDVDIKWLDKKYRYVGFLPDKKTFIFEDRNSINMPYMKWNSDKSFAWSTHSYGKYFVDFDGNILNEQAYYKVNERLTAYIDDKRMYIYQPLIDSKILTDRAYGDLQYDKASDCYRFLEKVGKVYKYGILNGKGEVIVEPVYDTMAELKGGITKVRKGGDFSVINTKGETLTEADFEKSRELVDYVEVPILDEVEIESRSIGNGLEYVRMEHGRKVVDADGNKLLEGKFYFPSSNVDGHIVISDLHEDCSGVLNLDELVKGEKQDEK